MGSANVHEAEFMTHTCTKTSAAQGPRSPVQHPASVPPFSKLLIANRGEIAVCIARTARGLGIATVAVYSDPDRNAPHVAACDEAIALRGSTAAESYLSIDRIIAAARRTGAQAVHPGYGFLAENADFADACAARRLTFVGPSPAAIRLMGNKSAAKSLMREHGVPCVPGFEGDQSAAALLSAAETIGFPVMIKAAAGGGGKGMRLVASPEAFAGAVEATRGEAVRAFGSGDLLLEKALDAPRHVEVQIFGDAFGTIAHLGERDCSMQRRHQKIVEEAPSTAVDSALRERLGAAAIAAARAVGYAGAGTVEFLLAEGGSFYFLEMNTRLQVEHAVTEAVTGIDLVAWQLRIAAGEPLPLDEPRGPRAGHAIEARLYAEDPQNGFLPQAGRIVAWAAPAGDGIRVDHALAAGLEISRHYDPMLAKVIAHGADRETARRRLIVALEALTLFGITTNRRFLIDALAQPGFTAGDVRTDFIARHPGLGSDVPDAALLALAAVLAYLRDAGDGGWHSTGVATAVVRLQSNDSIVTATISTGGGGRFDVTIGGERRALTVSERSGDAVRFHDGDRERDARCAWDGDMLHLQSGRAECIASDRTYAPSSARAAAGGGAATSPMPGLVASVAVGVGDVVVNGQPLVVLEAMKMLHEIVATVAGRVSRILVAPGDQVGMRALLVEIEAEGTA